MACNVNFDLSVFRQQQMALLLAQTIETTCLWAAQQGTMAEEADVSSLVLVKADASHRIAIRSMAGRCSDAALLAQTFKRNHPELRLINHLVRSIAIFASSFLQVDLVCWFEECAVPFRHPEAGHRDSALLSPISVPDSADYGHQGECGKLPGLVKTWLNGLISSLQLAVSPQPRVAGEPVTTPIGAHLAVKVEGVAQLTSQQKVCRKVRAVQVTVTSQSNVPTPDTKVKNLT